MKDLFIILLMAALFLLPGCTPSQETTNDEKEEEEVYVFDQVPEETAPPVEVIQHPDVPYYIIQIGAFIDKAKADAFASDSKNIINEQIEVKYSSSVNLYVVQLKTYYKTRSEAENVRNKLWQTDGYGDAWIITVQ